MPINVEALQSFTAAEQLKLVEYAIAQVMVGGKYTMTGSGQQFTQENLPALRAWRDQLITEVICANEPCVGGGEAIVRFGERY